MGYLFLSIALFVGALKGYCGKRMSDYVKSPADSMFVNTIRMLFCILIGFGFALIMQGSISAFLIDGKTLLISAVSGCATATFVIAWLISVKNGAYMMVETFSTLGIFVPLLLCFMSFGEKIVWLKWVGLAILVVAAYIMCSYNNNIKPKLHKTTYLTLSLCGIANGLVQFSQKWFNYEMNSRLTGGLVDATVFNFYTYVFAALTLLISLFFFRRVEKKETKTSPLEILKNVLLYVSLMSICLFMHSYFTTLAGSYLDSSELYPLQQGVGLILSLLMSAIFFKEKITKKCVVGVGLTFLSLLLINVIPNLIS